MRADRIHGIAATGFLLASTAFLSACIGVRSGMVGHYTPPLVPVAGDASIALSVTATIVFDDREEDAPTSAWSAWTDFMLHAYGESRLFSDVRRYPEEADYLAEIHIENTGKGRPLLVGLLCALSLNLIPSTHYEQFEVSTIFKDKGGSALGSYSKTERVRVWYQTLLIFGIPFAGVGTIQREAFFDLAYATLEEARAAGLF